MHEIQSVKGIFLVFFISARPRKSIAMLINNLLQIVVMFYDKKMVLFK